MKYLLITLFLSLAWIVSVFPNEDDGTDTTGIYYEDLSHLLSVRIYPLAKINSLELKVPDGTISLQPNGTGSIGLGFNYKWLGFGFSVGFPASKQSIEEKGETGRFDMQFSYFGKRLAADGFIQQYKGYYMANPSDFITWDNEYYPKARDLWVFSLGGSVHYIFNSDKLSVKAAYLRNQIQKKSAGSFAAGLFLYKDKVGSEQGFIPPELPIAMQQSLDLKEFDAFTIGVSAGYIYTFVLRNNFFLNISGFPGIGYRRFDLKTLDDNHRSINTLGVQLIARSAVGYEFKHFYMGLTMSVILRNFSYNVSEVNLGTGQVRLTFGKRFDLSRKE
ncbi:MAG: DUF4421 family protein [Bacteroidales bacterium]|nr:DUF4421 family protein [Bacteroidales bacterium]